MALATRIALLAFGGLALPSGASTSPSMDLPQACTEACPNIVTASEEMNRRMAAFQAALPEVDKADAGKSMTNMMGAVFDVMCDFKTEVTCLADNQAICTPDGATPNPLLGVSGNFDCFCSSCPDFGWGYGEWIGSAMDVMTKALMAAFGGQGEAITEDEMQAMLEKGQCAVADSLACIQGNPQTCDGIFDSLASGGMTMNTSFASADPEVFKQDCMAKGFATSASRPADMNENLLSTSGARSRAAATMAAALAALAVARGN